MTTSGAGAVEPADAQRMSMWDEPVCGGLLVGGASRRMGMDKALVEIEGRALGERVEAALRPHVAETFLLGDGPVPATLAALPRLRDADLASACPDLARQAEDPANRGAGPLAGILAALRARPGATWVICPCDLPAAEPEAVAWLLAQRRPGDVAVLPRPAPDAPPQPLFALYLPAALPRVEELAAAGVRAPRRLADQPGVRVVPVPPGLAHCWQDADTQDDLTAFRGAP